MGLPVFAGGTACTGIALEDILEHDDTTDWKDPNETCRSSLLCGGVLKAILSGYFS